VAELSQETSPVDRCHSVLSRATTMPITNRSYASVKKPMPEMNMIFNWNRVILESSSVANASGSDAGAVMSLMARQ